MMKAWQPMLRYAKAESGLDNVRRLPSARRLATSPLMSPSQASMNAMAVASACRFFRMFNTQLCVHATKFKKILPFNFALLQGQNFG